MTCRRALSILGDFLDGVLPVEVEAALRAHFVACPQCLAFLESYRGAGRIIRAATELTMPKEMEERLRRFLEKNK